MRSVVVARRLLLAEQIVEQPFLLIEEGRIAAFGSRTEQELPANAQLLDFDDAFLAPAYLDIHVHGGAGHDVMEGTPEAMQAVSTFLASRGVGAYFPTTVTAGVDKTLRALAGLADCIEAAEGLEGARPLGIHLEGPFLSHTKRGVHPPAQLQPASVALFDQFWEAARGHVRLMTVAPEIPGAIELIRHATERGVRCSLGHSDANTEEALAGIEAGGKSATHSFNAMRRLDHRDPGIAGVVLDRDDLFAEIICDGLHVHPAMVRLFLKAKGAHRGILITDGISATGMPEGNYMLGDFEVEVANGRCTHDGVLAGSVLTLDLAVRNLVKFTRAEWQTAVRMATANPALLTGVSGEYGNVSVGAPANITVLSPQGHIVETLIGGRPTRNLSA